MKWLVHENNGNISLHVLFMQQADSAMGFMHWSMSTMRHNSEVTKSHPEEDDDIEFSVGWFQ